MSDSSLTKTQIRLIAVAAGLLHMALALVILGAAVWFLVTTDYGPSAHETADEITLAVAGNDFETLCDLYSDDSRPDAMAAVGADDCEEYVARQEAAIHGDGVDMKVLEVEEHGDKATVTYSVRSGLIEATDEFTLVREDGDWVIDGVPDFDPRDRPLRSELAGVLHQQAGLGEADASCVAGELLKSDLTDAELQELLYDEVTTYSDDDIKRFTDVLSDAFEVCGVGDVVS